MGASSVSNRRHAPSLAYTGVNRHASDTRIGLMDSTVPIEALVNGVPYPRQGMPICSKRMHMYGFKSP